MIFVLPQSRKQNRNNMKLRLRIVILSVVYYCAMTTEQKQLGFYQVRHVCENGQWYHKSDIFFSFFFFCNFQWFTVIVLYYLFVIFHMVHINSASVQSRVGFPFALTWTGFSRGMNETREFPYNIQRGLPFVKITNTVLLLLIKTRAKMIKFPPFVYPVLRLFHLVLAITRANIITFQQCFRKKKKKLQKKHSYSRKEAKEEAKKAYLIAIGTIRNAYKLYKTNFYRTSRHRSVCSETREP